ncbi:unnamed protein product [Oppiella nova]|uniref:Uncharacterized protein n=1 Tax=Oppiella nova TaxID=334625 RepID=A0A7R9QSH3_9ACAR|nr:unnamed protein product [Oppiella nova]CAG2173365.1 unnamed protein product [Oppiella nova]
MSFLIWESWAELAREDTPSPDTPVTITNVALTPIVNTTITYNNRFVCNSSANSALNISSVLTSGHTTAAITCNGLTAHTNDVSFIAHQSQRVSITNITVGHYQAVNTFTYGIVLINMII